MRPSGGPRPRPSLGNPFIKDEKPVIKPFNIRPSLEDNKFSTLASLSPINPGLSISPFPALPSQASSTSKPGTSSPLKKPFAVTSKDHYTMKTPESFIEAVDPSKTRNPKERETFEFHTLQVSPVFALEKDYENYDLRYLIRPLFTDRNYVDTDNPHKTRKFYEFILVDTGSIEVEHQLKDDDDPKSVSYSKFTIKKIYSPFTWLADHLHTPINLSREHKPQTYNWYDYRNAWFNFIYLRPNTHTWFVKYGPEVTKAIIPRWFYEWWNCFGGNLSALPKTFQDKYLPFQTEKEISSLSEHIKLCKFFIAKRISYIISWKFSIKEFDRIRYLSKEVLIKGWTPAPKETTQVSLRSSPKERPSPTKNDLKRRLKKALQDIDDEPDEDAILKLLDEASSQSEDNGDMMKPKGLAQAYLDHYYDES